MRHPRRFDLLPGFVLCLAASVACGSSSDPSEGEVADGGADTSSSSGSTPNPQSDASTSECTANADCRAFESTCGSCSCLALVASAADPVCQSEPVSCFAPSCTDKLAACEQRHCVLVPR